MVIASARASESEERPVDCLVQLPLKGNYERRERVRGFGSPAPPVSTLNSRRKITHGSCVRPSLVFCCVRGANRVNRVICLLRSTMFVFNLIVFTSSSPSPESCIFTRDMCACGRELTARRSVQAPLSLLARRTRVSAALSIASLCFSCSRAHRWLMKTVAARHSPSNSTVSDSRLCSAG